MINRKHRNSRSRERGQALVEFALVATVFFLFLFGIMDCARLFQSWVGVQHAAREGARFAITGRSDCPDYGITGNRTGCIQATARSATTGMAGGGVSSATVGVNAVYWGFDSSTSPPGWAGGSGTSGAGEPCDEVEVRVSYRHHFVSPMLKAVVPGGIGLTGKQRMVNEPWAQCT